MKVQKVIPSKSDNILILWYHESIANSIIHLYVENEIWDCSSVEKLLVIK